MQNSVRTAIRQSETGDFENDYYCFDFVYISHQ